MQAAYPCPYQLHRSWLTPQGGSGLHRSQSDLQGPMENARAAQWTLLSPTDPALAGPGQVQRHLLWEEDAEPCAVLFKSERRGSAKRKLGPPRASPSPCVDTITCPKLSSTLDNSVVPAPHCPSAPGPICSIGRCPAEPDNRDLVWSNGRSGHSNWPRRARQQRPIWGRYRTDSSWEGAVRSRHHIAADAMTYLGSEAWCQQRHALQVQGQVRRHGRQRAAAEQLRHRRQ